MIRLTLPYPPTVNHAKAVVRGRLITSREGRRYFETARMLARAAYKGPLLTGPVELRLDVYRPRRIGDLSNRIKVLEDALVGVVLEDDSQVTRIVAARFEDKTNPRVEVEIELLSA